MKNHCYYRVEEQNKDLLGEAPIQTQATAQKCRETPMGRTGIVEYKAFHKVAKRE
ncbi:hypothetical protein IGK74_000100 [Enterococcus sp. AZ150]|uniref:Uncharacterized protein n=1 Tax=Enterococcus sulfureus ATCC 49903 TaxID=1140003 RepID=S0KMA3_9ENTE|nr:hypothetical protein OMY_01935 [Enterococcus sulfureus ATCC 49903]EOT83035.1 hypothetical protein I573_02148 [Enterococcus sulfureus ATCC 49903]